MLELESLTERIIGCAIEVHRGLGPGLLESTYEAALSVEMADNGLSFLRQPSVSVAYKGRHVGQLRPDFIVESAVIVELKCVQHVDPVFHAQVLTYLKATGLKVGLFMNFHALTVKGRPEKICFITPCLRALRGFVRTWTSEVMRVKRGH